MSVTRTKYKHKKTGDIVEYNHCYVKYYEGKTSKGVKIYLPIALVEDSNDWEKING